MGYKTRSNYALAGGISQEEFDRIFKRNKDNKKTTDSSEEQDVLFCGAQKEFDVHIGKSN